MTTLALEVKKVEAAYLSRNGLRRPVYSIYRIDGGETRWYYREDKDRYYPSVTSVIQATCPTPFGLIQWIKNLGEKADGVRDRAAEYGTWFHIQAARRLVDGEYDVSTMESSLRFLAAENGYVFDDLEWLKSAKQDILAFEQFVRDHSVMPIAVEACLTSEGGYAGAVDLVCKMRVGTGQSGKFLKKDEGGEEITAVIDFKTGRKGFYESHEIQLHMYRNLVQENFGITVDRVFNWAPKDWRGVPSYHLKDQTDSREAAKIPHLLAIFAMNGRTGPSDSLILKGMIKPDKPITDFYAFEGMRERIKKGDS